MKIFCFTKNALYPTEKCEPELCYVMNRTVNYAGVEHYNSSTPNIYYFILMSLTSRKEFDNFIRNTDKQTVEIKFSTFHLGIQHPSLYNILALSITEIYCWCSLNIQQIIHRKHVTNSHLYSWSQESMIFDALLKCTVHVHSYSQ